MKNLISKVISRVRNIVWNKRRKRINNINRSRLNDTGRTASILSMNCSGGIISHDLGLKFLSPTVNLFMRAGDFIKFCENLEYYFSIDEMIPCTDTNIIGERTYPIVYLDDLTLFLVHYSSIEEAQRKWNERKKRINWDNIVILNTDREGMTEDLKARFERLPYRKVLFTHVPDDKNKSCFFIQGYEHDTQVGIITEPEGWNGKRPIDQFDYVGLLNGYIGTGCQLN